MKARPNSEPHLRIGGRGTRLSAWRLEKSPKPAISCRSFAGSIGLIEFEIYQCRVGQQQLRMAWLKEAQAVAAKIG